MTVCRRCGCSIVDVTYVGAGDGTGSKFVHKYLEDCVQALADRVRQVERGRD